MTRHLIKNIGFGLLVLGLLTGSMGDALAQIRKGEARMAGGALQTAGGGIKGAAGIVNVIGGVVTGNKHAVNKGKEQIEKSREAVKKGTENAAYGAAKRAQGVLNFNVPIVGSLTGKAGDKAAASVIRKSGDDAAKYVAQKEIGVSEENLSKVSAATKDDIKGTAGGNRNAVKYEVTNADGSKSYVLMDANMKATEGIMEGCIPIPVKLDQLRKCIFCPLFLVLYNTAEAMATTSYNTLYYVFTRLLLLGFALYISFITLKQVSAFTKQDAPKYITEVLTITFKVGLAWLLLMNGSEVYRLGLEPILNAGLDLGSAFLTHQESAIASTDASGNTTIGAVGGVSCESPVSNAGSGGVFYSRGLYAHLDCFMKKVTQEIAVSQSLGSSLMCVARNKASGVIFWDFSMFTTGLIMWAFAWFCALSFAWYLIDQVIRLGVVGALLPFLIAAWPFKITSGYTGTGWKMFLTAFFTFVFAGLVISVNVELASQAATGGSGNAQELLTNINGNNVEDILKTFDIGLSGLLFMLLCCIFGWKLCADATALAAEFGGAKAPDTGAKLGSVAAGLAKGAATRGANLAVSGAKIAGNAIHLGDGESLSSHIGEKADSVRESIGARTSKFFNKFTPAGRQVNAQQNRGNTSTDNNNSRDNVDTNNTNTETTNQNQNQNTTNDEVLNNNNSSAPTPTNRDESAENSSPTPASPNPQPEAANNDTSTAEAAARAEAPREENDDGANNSSDLEKQELEALSGDEIKAINDAAANESNRKGGDNSGRQSTPQSYRSNSSGKENQLKGQIRDLQSKISELESSMRQEKDSAESAARSTIAEKESELSSLRSQMAALEEQLKKAQAGKK